ncbi:CheR family methyltransferase [Paracoccus aerodenitrificans]|uniref:CheR family methyltransferase n=1 Tax=Paracoccus aerodenitrificans TaxID=3017781 RepID=UPI0022F0BD30|nr:protein-glutamate O-methyltransferase CheR [Paracoccus aerodenitrificans]WBU62801.1 protein-glutamate O-methyltransferase CheR [Paracoccus aerodenitrificans]
MKHYLSPRPEWSMSDQEFDQLRKTIYDYSGIVIGPEKRSMIRARLQKRLFALKLDTLAEYLKMVSGMAGTSERERFVSSLTTNVTSFFRENHHFTLLTKEILPALAERNERIHIWSAGCSSGQEPYSIAMAVLDELPQLAGQVQIFATDIDSEILARAKAGIYRRSETSGVRVDRLSRHFTQLSGSSDSSQLKISQRISSMVNFCQLNINAQWPVIQRFDVIFCRNVAIYFDQETQRRLWRKFSGAMRDGGWLLIGHSERVPTEFHEILKPVGVTAYRKPI